MMNNKKTRKAYAYGSMVRKPMQMGGMTMSANPMMPRTQQGMQQGIQPAMGMPKMAYGGKMRKKMAMGGKNEKFAALAPPRDKITYADKIAGAKRNG